MKNKKETKEKIKNNYFTKVFNNKWIQKLIDKNNRKKVIIFGIVVLVLFLIIAFSNHTGKVNMKKIMEDIPSEITYYEYENEEYNMNVTDIKINKRNTTGKQDIIYLTINMKGDIFSRSVDYKFVYNKYSEGGWVLDQTNKESAYIYALNDKIDDTILKMGREYYQENKNENVECNKETFTCVYTADVSEDHPYLSATGKFSYTFELERSDGEEEYWWSSTPDQNNITFKYKTAGKWSAEITESYYKYRVIVTLSDIVDGKVQVDGYAEDIKDSGIKEMKFSDEYKVANGWGTDRKYGQSSIKSPIVSFIIMGNEYGHYMWEVIVDKDTIKIKRNCDFGCTYNKKFDLVKVE